MAFPLLGTPKPQFFDSNGDPLVSGTLAILNPADDTNKASYPTNDDAEARTNANSNPLTLNSRGEPSSGLFGLDDQSYKLVLKDSSGTTIWTVDDVFLPRRFPSSDSPTIKPGLSRLNISTSTPQAIIAVQAYTRNATIVENRTLLQSSAATAENNNNVIAALIADLQQRGVL